MRHRFLISPLLIIICGFSPYGAADIFAQNLARLPLGSRGLDSTESGRISQDTVYGNKYNFSQFGNETWSFVKQPTRWDGNDWLKLGLASAGTFLIMQADQPIRNAVLRDNNKYYYSVPIEGGRMWGDLSMPVLLFGGFAAYSLLTDDIGTRKIAYEIGQASIYAGVLTQILKFSIGRSRPYVNNGSKSFRPFSSFSFIKDYQSFPGGHSTIAFVLSTVLSRNSKPVWLKVLAYVPAVLTFVSRVYQDQHWTSDDFIGGALGYSVATWVVDHHEQNDGRVNVSSIFPLTISITLN